MGQNSASSAMAKGSCAIEGQYFAPGQTITAFANKKLIYNSPASVPNRALLTCASDSNRVAITCLENGQWDRPGHTSCENQLELPSQTQAYRPTVDDHIIGMYMSAVGRLPEGAGFTFWKQSATRSNWALPRLSQEISNGAGAAYPYIDGLTTRNFVAEHFQLTYGLAPDTDTETLWANMLIAGTLTRRQIHAVINNALMTYSREVLASLPQSAHESVIRQYWAFHHRRLAAMYYLSKFPTRAIRVGDSTYKLLEELFLEVSDDPDTLLVAYKSIDSI